MSVSSVLTPGGRASMLGFGLVRDSTEANSKKNPQLGPDNEASRSSHWASFPLTR